MTARILLALKDDAEISSFRELLEARGIGATVAKDGAGAIESAVNAPPGLVIIDLDLPVVDGARVYRILRKNRLTSGVPFIFISDDSADLKGFNSGLDTFLTRPFNPEEVFGRIRQVLSSGPGPAEKELSGRLDRMGLADVVQFLNMNRRDGELKLSSGTQNGVVYLKAGEVQNAVIDGIEKEKAFYRLLSWSSGEFEFLPRPVEVPSKIRSSTSNLIMEGLRQLDELRRSETGFPGRKDRLRARDGAGAAGLSPISHEVMQLLKLFSTVGEVVDRSSFPDYDVYKTLSGMVSKGIVEIEKAAPGAGPEEPGLFSVDDGDLRERLGRFSDVAKADKGKIFVLASSGPLVEALIEACTRKVPGFNINTATYLSGAVAGVRFGEVASLRVKGGMNLIIFSIPRAKNMGPILKAFSSNLAGLITLSGDCADGAREIAEAREGLLGHRAVPSVHVSLSEEGKGPGEDEIRKEFALSPEDPVVLLGSSGPRDVFTALLKAL